MSGGDDIGPVEIRARKEPSWWDFEITPMRLLVAMLAAVFCGMWLAWST